MEVNAKMKLGDEVGRDNTRVLIENETSEGKWWYVVCLCVVVRLVMKEREMLILIAISSARKLKFSLGWCPWDVWWSSLSELRNQS